MACELKGTLKFFFIIFLIVLILTFLNNIILSNYFIININSPSYILDSINLFYKEITIPNNELKTNKPSVFCIIPTHKNHFDSRAKLMYETWAHECDGYKFISAIQPNSMNASSNDSDKNEINYKGFNILQPPGLNESLNGYNRLTDKVFLSFKYLYNRYNNYDWYLKADDDTYIFINNLRKFLSDKNSSAPITYGYDFNLIIEKGYHSGGAGYVLSKESFNRIGKALNRNYSFCQNTNFEDVDVAGCLRKLFVYKEKSIDQQGRGNLTVFDYKLELNYLHKF
jgi:glycoprotein-N-acetylgalactosamine 3-beta-galactosyltransferase